mgnify:CR=1 FL=1
MEDQTCQEDQYYIKPDSLKTDLATDVINENGSESNGTKVYKIKKWLFIKSMFYSMGILRQVRWGQKI